MTQVDKLVKVDRYLLSRTWWDLLQKLSARNPTALDKWMVGQAYNRIISAMDQKTDAELLQDMSDIIDSIQYVSLNIPGLGHKGVFNPK